MLVFGAIASAILAWAIAESWRVFTGIRSDFVPRVLWTAGAVLAVVHSVAAFAVFHSWSHDAAVDATAKQTAELIGVAWGGGIFFNYAFLATWIADAIWWWISPRTYAHRPAMLSGAIRGFLWFMFVNGAIVFADGAMRVLGILAVGLVSVAWLMKSFRQIAP